MTISFGFWMIPAVITIISFWWSSSKYNEEKSKGYIPFPNNFVEFIIACMISGSSWFIYFVTVLIVKDAWM